MLAVKDLYAAVKRYRQAYALPEPLRQVDKEFGAHLAAFGGSPVVLAQPLTAGSWLSDRIEKFGEGPCAIILSAARAQKYRASGHSQWFGTRISWFDPQVLGWRLGFE